MHNSIASSTVLRHQAGLMPTLCLHDTEPHIRPSPKTGPEMITTALEYIRYAYRLTDIRISTWYDQAPPHIKAIWQNDADALLHFGSKLLLSDDTTEEARVIHHLTEAIKLQRRREKELAHVTSKVMLDIWMGARKHAEDYLRA